MSIHERDNDVFTDFDSRWESRNDFLKDLKELNLKTMTSDGKSGGVPLYSDGQIAHVDSSDSHSLIIGSTGSKKTRLIAMPTLQILARAGESFVATDPKGELYDRTYELLKKNSYEIILINLRNPSTGNCWNPLYLPYELYKSNDPVKKDKARELLGDLACSVIPITNTKDPFWESSAQDFLLGLLELLFRKCSNENEINLKSVCLLRAHAMAELLIKKYYYETIDKNSYEYVCLSGTVEAPDNTRSSILSVFDQHMRIFSSQDVLIQLLSSNDIDFSKLGNKKTALFLIMPDEKTTYHKLISVFIKQCYEQLILEAQSTEDISLPVRVNFVLDEFSSLPTINDFPAMITAARSRNIRFNLIVQSEHQLKSRYGDEAQTIKGNCNNWLFLTSREKSLLEEIRDLSGNKSRDIPLISISKLQRLDKDRGQVLILHGRSYPYVSTLADISKYFGCEEKGIKVTDAIKVRDSRELVFFDFIALNEKLRDEKYKEEKEKRIKRIEQEKWEESERKEIKENKEVLETFPPYPVKFHNGDNCEFSLVKLEERYYVTDQGKTYEMLDEAFNLREPDVIKNLIAIMKERCIQKVGDYLMAEIENWNDIPEDKKMEHLEEAKCRLFACVSFMDTMRIFYV